MQLMPQIGFIVVLVVLRILTCIIWGEQIIKAKLVINQKMHNLMRLFIGKSLLIVKLVSGHELIL